MMFQEGPNPQTCKVEKWRSHSPELSKWEDRHVNLLTGNIRSDTARNPMRSVSHNLDRKLRTWYAYKFYRPRHSRFTYRLRGSKCFNFSDLGYIQSDSHNSWAYAVSNSSYGLDVFSLNFVGFTIPTLTTFRHVTSDCLIKIAVLRSVIIDTGSVDPLPRQHIACQIILKWSPNWRFFNTL